MSSRKKKTEENKAAAKPTKSHITAAKEKRRKAWEAQQKENNKAENTRDEFRKFFIKIKGKLGLTQDMEEIIWIHFKSAGFDSKEKFEAGIKHFGYKL